MGDSKLPNDPPPKAGWKKKAREHWQDFVYEGGMDRIMDGIDNFIKGPLQKVLGLDYQAMQSLRERAQRSWNYTYTQERMDRQKHQQATEDEKFISRTQYLLRLRGIDLPQYLIRGFDLFPDHPRETQRKWKDVTRVPEGGFDA